MTDAGHIISQLSPADAVAILQALAASDEALAGRIAALALARIQPVDVEEVAAVLYDELEALEVEEVWERAGRKRHGYVEPSEVADKMVEAALTPVLEDLARYQSLGLRTEASRMCKGLLLGFYRFHPESTSEFKNWTPDAPPSSSQRWSWTRGSRARPTGTTSRRRTIFVAESWAVGAQTCSAHPWNGSSR